jgi:hypothetical protein
MKPKPRYIAVQCPWCRGDHWLVKPNICTSRSLQSIASYPTRAEAEDEAARQSAKYLERRPPGCRQTTCRYCDQDIEGLAPYRAGGWRDRGNNTHCPTPEGDAGRQHAPLRLREREI